jgi:hypothetical protein
MRISYATKNIPGWPIYWINLERNHHFVEPLSNYFVKINRIKERAGWKQVREIRFCFNYCIYNNCIDRNYTIDKKYKQMNQDKQTGYETFFTYGNSHTPVWELLPAFRPKPPLSPHQITTRHPHPYAADLRRQ